MPPEKFLKLRYSKFKALLARIAISEHYSKEFKSRNIVFNIVRQAELGCSSQVNSQEKQFDPNSYLKFLATVSCQDHIVLQRQYEVAVALSQWCNRIR